MDGYVANNELRNYQLMAEYILFYTFQGEIGLTTIMLDTNNFPTLRKYFYDLLCYLGESNCGITKKIGHRKAENTFYILPKKSIIDKIGLKTAHCLRYGSSQWDMPTKETYQELITVFKINQWQGFREYESLRLEYESLRYTFNNQKTHHSVWNYEIEFNAIHPTQKPLPLICNIIRHSSNEGDLILDPFVGSGTTAVACVNLNRHFIGIEKDKGYFNIARNRIEEAKVQLKLF